MMTGRTRDGAVRRRGLFAGAGAVLAGWVAAHLSDRAEAQGAPPASIRYTAGETTTSRILTVPDGSTRLLYATESPEAWVEDFGRGTLTAGNADIPLAADFAALINTDDYHVFLTRYGADGNALAVVRTGPQGFTVIELGGGTSGATFSWRVLAKLRGVGGERLASVTVPTPLPLPLIPPVPPVMLPPSPPATSPLPQPPRHPEPPASSTTVAGG